MRTFLLPSLNLIYLLLALAKAESDCCELPKKKATKDDKEEETTSVAAAGGASEDAAAARVLSELVGIFTFKEKQREGSEGFSLLYPQLVLVRVLLNTTAHHG